MSLTDAQQAAIRVRGNVLVVAGAGTGKTRTLVERCIQCLVAGQPPASLDEILMVTFTEAAAAEMRQRIRARLEEESQRDPGNGHWQEQLALFETAHLGTLHSFCLKLVRQHFYELELDPQLGVLTEEEGRILAGEMLDKLLQAHYAGQTAAALAVQELIHVQGGGRDQTIRALVMRLHHYTQTLPDPAEWYRGQLAIFASPEPAAWRRWFVEGLAQWAGLWLPRLERASAENTVAAAGRSALRRIGPGLPAAETARALEEMCAAPELCPPRKKTRWVNPFEDFFEEAEFLASLAAPDRAGDPDPLAQDWEWVRGQMRTLLELAGEFTAAFSDAKRELGMVDFHDLEQHALRLLWDAAAARPTAIASAWRQQLRFVFVDEYQDINAAQDQIIQALSREGAEANRCLVGDVKQSIYRFRLANPYIFQGYGESWHGEQGTTIPLLDNFRSREGVLEFINSLFELILRREVGGVAYDEQARLRFGAPQDRQPLSAAASPSPRVEIQLRVKGGLEGAGDDAELPPEVGELLEAEKEARLVALRLRDLRLAQHAIWDEPAGAFRPVDWRDMAVLLRSPSGKAESYAKEFSKLGIPLQVHRRGFYESAEILDLLSLLRLLDNPLQDVPAIAVLHSPLVGLTLDELARLRLAARGPFWSAVVLWHETETVKLRAEDSRAAQLDLPLGHAAFRKVSRFLERYAHWRRLARQVSLSRCLEAVLTETHYAEWLLTQPRGEQRHANVRRLLTLAQQFDQFQRQSLFRFLGFVETQQSAETEPEVAAVAEENAVRLMSIHQSKGLEFPLVVVADLGKAFNLSDLRADVILDECYGLCPQIKPPETGRRYPSLPYWLARQRQRRETLGEELRLLYVAMTRARDTLILAATLSKTQYESLGQPMANVGPSEILDARGSLDWLCLWLARTFGAAGPPAVAGENELVRWWILDDASLLEREAQALAPVGDSLAGTPEVWRELEQRLAWFYPFRAATQKPAKTSVTVLRHAARQADDDSANPVSLPWPEPESTGDERGFLDPSAPSGQPSARLSGTSATGVGNAHHAFLELVSLERTASLEDLKTEARRMAEVGCLPAAEVALLDFPALAAFWQSDLGARIRTHARAVRRELAFTARFSATELAALANETPAPELDGEFVVVQGAVDLAVLLPEEIWIVDFKTDRVAPGPEALAAKAQLYAPQLELYARALARIYDRPVSAAWLYFLSPRAAVPMKP